MSGATKVFRRRLAYQLADIGCVPVLFLMCLGSLVVAVTRPGTFPLDFAVFFIGGFTLVFGAMFARTLRHGVPRIAVKVGPNGIWLPEAGWLSWDEIEEVRLEILVNPAATSDPSQLSRRLGIMPRDRGLRARRPIALRIGGPLYSLYINRFNPYTVGPPVKLAPFGVEEYPVIGGLDPVLAAIAEHQVVVEHRGALAGMD
jgi:hypothetical protein